MTINDNDSPHAASTRVFFFTDDSVKTRSQTMKLEEVLSIEKAEDANRRMHASVHNAQHTLHPPRLPPPQDTRMQMHPMGADANGHNNDNVFSDTFDSIMTEEENDDVPVYAPKTSPPPSTANTVDTASTEFVSAKRALPRDDTSSLPLIWLLVGVIALVLMVPCSKITFRGSSEQAFRGVANTAHMRHVNKMLNYL